MGKTRIWRGAITEDSNGTVREIVAHDPYAVGFISLGLVNDEVRALDLDGVLASEANITGRPLQARPALPLPDQGGAGGHGQGIHRFRPFGRGAGADQEGRAYPREVAAGGRGGGEGRG